jgi:transcriptional regulator with XRE-family HTH domain
MTMQAFRPTLRLLLTAALQESGLQQQQLAAKIGVSPNTVTTWLRGYNEPQVSHLIAMADVTGCPWLLDLRVLVDDDQSARGVSGGATDGPVSAGCCCISPGQRPFFANEAPSFN